MNFSEIKYLKKREIEWKCDLLLSRSSMKFKTGMKNRQTSTNVDCIWKYIVWKFIRRAGQRQFRLYPREVFFISC